MNIEIADRLVKMRKKNGYSQEELADKLGLSRQAVSKWERAEASPDTDNLICLAKLYNVSLDDLLNTSDDVDTIIKEQVEPEEKTEESKDESEKNAQEETKKDSSAETESNEEKTNSGKKGHEKINIDQSGIHIIDDDGSEAHVGCGGIHIKESMKDVKRKCKYHKQHCFDKKHTVNGIILSSLMLLALVAYVLLGTLVNMWYNAWVVFFVPEIIASFVRAIEYRKFTKFNIAFVALFAFFFVCMVMPGLSSNLWNPMWIVFLAIPIYYTIFGSIDKAIEESKRRKGIDVYIKSDAIDNDDEEDDEDDDNEDEDDK